MKFLDLFSGIGGFRVGMEMAGHECVGHIEIDKYANISYAAMHSPKESEFFGTDIRAVEPKDLPDADIYCGGFPCQAFSIAGKRGGFEDMRGTLIFEVFRLAAERKPKILFLENVKGILNHDGGRTFGTIINALGELGYDAEWQLLNSKNFGVPQNRERVFIIGHLRGTGGGKVFPIRSYDEKVAELQGQYYNTVTARYGLAQGQGNYVAEGKQYAQEIKCIGNLMPSGNKNNSVPGRVYSSEGISPTLRTPTGGMTIPLLTAQDRHGVMINCLNPKKEDGTQSYQQDRVYSENGILPALNAEISRRNNINNGTRIRRLTPRECFRLQGFSDEYFDRARAVNSDSQLYKQAGNSVSVPVIYEIAKRF